jgi:signal transduction histidine kinase/FixJ family two-component response regulator
MPNEELSAFVPAWRRPPDVTATDVVFAGGGEMGRRMSAFDWSKTPLGPVSSWPQTLKTCVRIILTSRQPMFVWWGDELINLYNDAYKAIVGGKHPEALGQPAAVLWREIWDQVGPRAAATMRGNEGTYDEALLLIMERNGYPEETYYTFSYSPVPNDQGGTGGIICANTDDTPRIIGQRRLSLLRDLAAHTADARTAREACALAAQALASNAGDLPFAAIYLVEPDAGIAELVGVAGIEAGHPAAPEEIGLDDGRVWPVGEVLRRRSPVAVGDLATRVGSVPSGAWPRPPTQAVVRPCGDTAVLVVGLNPFRPLDDEYESFLHLVAGQIANAITNAVAYEDEKRRAEALAELDRAKTAFFSNVSHEFRTPLTLLLGPLRDQLDGARGILAPALRHDAEVMSRNAMRLLRLVNSLLDFSRIEAGRAQAVYAPIDLAGFTRELASVFRSAVERGGLRLSIDCPPLPAPVYVDRAMWEKVVLNLLSNAFKFTFEGGIDVTLRAERDRAVLRVRDSGVGVPPEELPRLFERFHRVEGTRARTHEGSGIGLALVQELVKMHGGTIEARSALGVGTTFTIALPFGDAHLPAERISAEAPSGTPTSGAEAYVDEALRWLPEETATVGAGPAERAQRIERAGGVETEGRRARIVLADDNADMRDYVARLLRERWEVEAVADGAAALDAIRARRPDLVLTDVMMPNLDGFGLLSALRADPATRGTPVIMLSARAGEEAKVQGLHAGADDYLVKPFSARELVARVETHLLLNHLRAAAENERARLHALFTSAPAIVAILKGPDHVFELANPPALQMIGKREVVGRPMREAIPEIGRQGLVEILDNVYRTGEPYVAQEAPYQLDRRNDGCLQDAFINFVFQPSFAPDGAVDGVLVYGFEVTAEVLARRKLEEEHRIAEAAQHQAETAVYARDEFLSIASHELRTPLTSLCLQADGALRALGRDPSQPAGSFLGRVEKIRRQAGRLEVLVQDLLDVSRLNAGRLQLRTETVELTEIARDVCDRLHDQAELAGSPIQLHTVGAVYGEWDPVRLDQVLTNLLTNAIKYGGKKPIEVFLETTAAPEDAAAPEAVIRVRDRGMGIARENHARIFERFERAVADRNEGGLGLGLWIARQFVELMGGTIAVVSAPGEGAMFVVRLPASIRSASSG